MEFTISLSPLRCPSATLRQARLRIDGRVDGIAWSNNRRRSDVATRTEIPTTCDRANAAR